MNEAKEGKQISIREAFEQERVISIAYAWEDICPYCHRATRSLDEEYSFFGDERMFESFSKEYGIYSPEEKIEQIEPKKYIYTRISEAEETCPICKYLLEN